MRRLGLERELVDRGVYQRTVSRFKDAGIALPTFAQLADHDKIPGLVRDALSAIDPDAPHALNLFRVHWYNDRARTGSADVPDHMVLPPALTGVDAKVVVVFGDRFPMIGAHKVLAAYGCLAPRIITGQFDPTAHRAIWPSTGNYCRGGVAISRIMECHGVAVLPEGMSQERFDWLDRWVLEPSDIVRTPGTESNVKEIYDKCAELSLNPANVIFNQFSEFGNHLVHYLCTGAALERVFDALRAKDPDLRLRAFTSATGSAGTLGAGDHLKERLGTMVVAVEAWECPTMLLNGFGEHNIQGIGDKHIPLIHNVMNTDMATAVSDRATDRVGVLWNTDEGRRYLVERRGVPASVVQRLAGVGLSGIANILAAVKVAKYFEMGARDAVVTVATDGYGMYRSERDKTLARDFPEGFDAIAAGEVFGEHVLGQGTDHLHELTHEDRLRIFNLGYFTWVEQQGIPLDEFVARKDPAFWTGIRDVLPVWDQMIEEFNGRTGALDRL
jgi:cysteine synthase A